MRIFHTSHTAYNVHTIRHQPLSEISGALGDLGTFLPIVIALTVNKSISLSSTLIFSGIFNILTGLFFGIPLPVQPMKAIAAVAIANGFSRGEIAAAGIFVGACIFLFSVTGLLRWFARAIPIPVVKGIQVGAGLSLVISAAGKLLSSLSWTHPSWADNYLWMIAAFLGLLATNIYRQIPYGLLVLILGLIFAFILLLSPTHHKNSPLPSFGLWHPHFLLPNSRAWKTGIINAGIGQIPLTTLNSIIAVVHLAGELLPSVTTPSITSIGLSVAAMNILSCWFGAMPMCHGSGGLAAQYRFGARSGASVIFLGATKLLLGIFFGNTLLGLLDRFPAAFLGVMVIAAGLELASVGESLNTGRAWDLRGGVGADGDGDGRWVERSLSESERKERWSVMLVTVGVLVAFKNDGIGFLAGILCHWSYRLPVMVDAVRDKLRHGGIRLRDTARADSVA
ncbi:hypothetical protein AJ80_06671 [Polytolypa hystricis UAMH7299]|uniref:Sulfate transporter n=1 Tax=Polytolypa hystricis (strain UAMH7299) TaxID=1447883 RepID=A0A2B7XVF5_POLH7|nr:hypothetical protein AJ80_06671 [Polytolypa hystricis UAMH7299]